MGPFPQFFHFTKIREQHRLKHPHPQKKRGVHCRVVRRESEDWCHERVDVDLKIFSTGDRVTCPVQQKVDHETSEDYGDTDQPDRQCQDGSRSKRKSDGL